MPDFQYIAREMSGQQTSGVLTAANEQDALRSLSARSLFPVKIDLAEETIKERKRAVRRVRLRHLSTFYTQLADLLKSGVPLLRSLELLQKQTTQSTLEVVIREIRDDVADGSRLADAMNQHPHVFGELSVSMVKAGEEGGFLEDVLKRIAGFTDHQEELRGRVVGAMVYPMFLLATGFIVVAVMLVFLFPKFAPIFDNMAERDQLPWATTLLLTLSDHFQRFYPLWLVGLVVVGVMAVRYVKTDAGRWQFDKFRLTVKGLGPIVRSLAIARFCRILGTLLKNGVPILQSLRISKDAAGNKVLSEAIAVAAENVSAGKSLAKPLSVSGHFPMEVVEMIAVGEEANNLEQVLIDIADNMERRTNRQLEMFVRLLEPIMLLFMAAIIMFVVVAILLPILQSSGAL